MHKNVKKLMLAIFATTMIACSTANSSSTNSNSSENTTQVAEKIGEDKLAGKYSEENSEYQYNEEDFSYPFPNVDITYKAPLFGWSINSISTDSTFEIEERTSVEDNIFSLVMYDWDGHFPVAYNKTSLLPEPILRGMISVNNCYGDTDSAKVGHSYETVTKKKHFAGYSVDDVYTTKINDRETSFFEGTVTLTDGAEGYVCGYTFIADGHVGGFVSGTWAKADDDAKETCKEFVDVGIRSLSVVPKTDYEERKTAEIKPIDLTTLSEETEDFYGLDLEYKVPSSDVLKRSSFTYDDFRNISLLVHDVNLENGVEATPDAAFEKTKRFFEATYLGYTDGELVVDNKEYVQEMVGDKTVDVVKFTGHLVNDITGDWKVYGYSFAYEGERGVASIIVAGVLQDINQSEETYQKVVKLTDDVFASLRPVSDD